MKKMRREFNIGAAWLIIFVMTSTISLLQLLSPLKAQQPQAAVNWGAWNFLIGDWVGEGGGAPGQGQGTFSFHTDLRDRVLIRKNHAEYPGITNKSTLPHDDLMVIYQEADKRTRATYWDNEGHVIEYSVEISADSSSFIFVSDSASSAPRFRLTYAKSAPDKVDIKFEIAYPNKPDVFSPYIQAKARKK